MNATTSWAVPADTVDIAPMEDRQTWRLPVVLSFVLLYLLALIVPMMHLHDRPAADYNWEAYTTADLLDFIDHPTADVLKINQGLMTTSGESAVVVGPMWVSTSVLGVSFGTMRLAMVLIAALTVPLTWFWGRILYSNSVGLGAALLVGTSQVFLLYARTATIVGISLTPAVIGFLVLWQVVRPDARRFWLWVAMLQVCLIANSYFYSPIRFLWPIAILLLAFELLMRSGERKPLFGALVATVVCLPLVLPWVMEGDRQTTGEAVRTYYTAREEQVLSMSGSRDYLISFVQVHSHQPRAELEEQSTGELIQRLIQINLGDLGDLLIDRHTLPAITDYWNPNGRLYDRVLVPFLMLALVILLWSVFRSTRSRYLLAIFGGFSLPMVLTTNVHIGRLVFLVPVLAVLVMVPVPSAVGWLERRRPLRERSVLASILPVPLCLAIAVLGAVPSLQDWFGTDFPTQPSEDVASTIRFALQESPIPQIGYVFGDDRGWTVERLRVATLVLQLDGATQFVDLKDSSVQGTGPVRVLYHGLLDRLQDPDRVPGYCTNLYVIDNNQLDVFLDVTSEAATEQCGAPLRYVVVP